MAGIEINFRTGKITIDDKRCVGCETHACISACARFGTNLLKLDKGHVELVYSEEETGRRCTEDMTCQIYCEREGNGALVLKLDSFGLDEYRRKTGLESR